MASTDNGPPPTQPEPGASQPELTASQDQKYREEATLSPDSPHTLLNDSDLEPSPKKLKTAPWHRLPGSPAGAASTTTSPGTVGYPPGRVPSGGAGDHGALAKRDEEEDANATVYPGRVHTHTFREPGALVLNKMNWIKMLNWTESAGCGGMWRRVEDDGTLSKWAFVGEDPPKTRDLCTILDTRSGYSSWHYGPKYSYGPKVLPHLK
jgi:hypothetical protein